MTAAGAESVEFEAVGLDREAVAGCDFFLETLDVTVFELDDLSAPGADKVVVVAFMRHIVILGLGAEMPGLSQAGFAEQVERAVNRGQSQVRIFSRKLVIEVFRGDVFLFQEGVQNQFTLSGELQLVFPEMLLQYPHFSGVLGHGDQCQSDWVAH
jgi:hypothetical protein